MDRDDRDAGADNLVFGSGEHDRVVLLIRGDPLAGPGDHRAEHNLRAAADGRGSLQ